MKRIWSIFTIALTALFVVTAVVLWITDYPVNHALFFIAAMCWFLSEVNRRLE